MNDAKRKLRTSSYTVDEVAKKLKRSNGQIHRMIQRKVLPAFHLGEGGKYWITKKAVQEFVKGMKPKKGPEQREPDLFDQTDPENDPTLAVGQTVFWRWKKSVNTIFSEGVIDQIEGLFVVIKQGEGKSLATFPVMLSEITIFVKK